MEDSTVKILEQFSNQISERINNSLELKLLQMEYRLNDSMNAHVSKKIEEALGTTSENHRQEHYNLRNITQSWNDFKRTISNRLVTGLVSIVLGAIAVGSVQGQANELPPAILSRDLHLEKPVEVKREADGEPK